LQRALPIRTRSFRDCNAAAWNGATYAGGGSGLGTAFAVTTGKQFTLLHSFNGVDGNSRRLLST
jgi:hypothetical protein